MIFCNLKGGLGNILFQVAATFEFANKNNVDCSFPNLYRHLSFLEKEKNCNPRLTNVDHYRHFFRVLRTDNPPPNTPTVMFPYHYEEKCISPPCIIDGFFQSEKYFLNSRNRILDLFPHREQNNKVSIHVRRGDYLTKTKFHNVLDIDYYLKAIEYFPGREFVIFSDDLEWCRSAFVGDRFSFFRGKHDLEDLFMMSSCHSNIISNSSFSWWAAWSNNHEDKKVIAPKKWVGPSLSHLDTKDVQCSNWLQL